MILQENPEHGFTIDALETMYPTLMTVFKKSGETGTKEGTVQGYVLNGTVDIKTRHFTAQLGEQGFFAAPGGVELKLGENTTVVTIERYGFQGLAQVGQREKRGRLSYIDGCSDTLIIPPARKGDCVLNHLHFPAGINQTQHIHPSIRMGIVAGGYGESWYEGHWWTKADGTREQLKAPWVNKLTPGSVFMLEEQEQHSFRTFKDTMDIIAYHPDSDCGPTDDTHPMIQRTYINHGKK